MFQVSAPDHQAGSILELPGLVRTHCLGATGFSRLCSVKTCDQYFNETWRRSPWICAFIARNCWARHNSVNFWYILHMKHDFYVRLAVARGFHLEVSSSTYLWEHSFNLISGWAEAWERSYINPTLCQNVLNVLLCLEVRNPDIIFPILRIQICGLKRFHQQPDFDVALQMQSRKLNLILGAPRHFPVFSLTFELKL